MPAADRHPLRGATRGTVRGRGHRPVRLRRSPASAAAGGSRRCAGRRGSPRPEGNCASQPSWRSISPTNWLILAAAACACSFWIPTSSRFCSAIREPGLDRAIDDQRGRDHGDERNHVLAEQPATRRDRPGLIGRRGVARSFDDLIRACEQRQRNRQAERLHGLAIDQQLELARRLHRQVGDLGAAQDEIDIVGRCALPARRRRTSARPHR